MAVLRRPAARGAEPAPGVRRRPSRHAPGERLWESGAVVALHEVPLGEFKPGSLLVVTEGDYFGAQIKAAGTIQRVEADHMSSYLHLRLTGTDNENVLKVHTGQRDPAFKVHLCNRDCGRLESGELFFHALKGRQGKDDGEEEWTKNLTGPGPEAVDELAGLRARGTGLGDGGGGVREAVPPEAPLQAAPEQKDHKKKKKREKSKDEKINSGRMPSRAVQKEAAHLYGGTGLDPNERVRKRVMKAAQRYASRKKAKRSSSSGGSSSSSSSSTTETGVTQREGVFAEETKTKAIGDKYPGALALETLTMMRRNLLATSGEEGEEQTTRPVALLYYRNVLGRRATGAQARELLNISCAIDALLRSRPAQALDILCQRLKAQESVLTGTTWQVAQKLELASPDATSLLARSELQTAQRENYLDSRAKWQTQASPSGKGNPKGKSKDKGELAHKDDKREDTKKDKGKGGGGKR